MIRWLAIPAFEREVALQLAYTIVVFLSGWLWGMKQVKEDK